MRSSEWSISFLRQLFSLTSRYWRSEEKKSAYAYLLGIVTLTIAAVYMTLLLNDWFNEFTARCRITMRMRSITGSSASPGSPLHTSPLRSMRTTCSSSSRSGGGAG